MFDGMKDFAQDMIDKNVKELQAKQQKEIHNRVNFVIEQTLDDGRKLTANSFNPNLLLKVFKEFVNVAEGKAGKHGC